MCCAQTGRLFDEARQCLTAEERVIACQREPIPADSACVTLGIVGCVLTRTDGVRRVWALAGRTGNWTADDAAPCSNELANTVLSAKRCE